MSVRRQDRVRTLASVRFGAIAGALFGLVVAIPVMYAAWDHNPQGEFHNELGVNWGNWLLIGVTWFAPVAALVFLISGTIHWLAARHRKDSPMTRNQWLGAALGFAMFLGALAVGWAINPWVSPIFLFAAIALCLRTMRQSPTTHRPGPRP